MEFSIEFISIVIIHSIGEDIHPWSCVGYLDRALITQDMNKQQLLILKTWVLKQTVNEARGAVMVPLYSPRDLAEAYP